MEPYLVKDVKLIKGVQRRAIKLVQDIANLTYDERLHILGLTQLEKRRVKSDLIKKHS